MINLWINSTIIIIVQIFCSSAQTPNTVIWRWTLKLTVGCRREAQNKVVSMQIDDITTFPEIVRGSKVVGVKERAPNLYSRTVAWSIQLQQTHKHHAAPSQTLLHPVWSSETREAHAKHNSYVFHPAFSQALIIFNLHIRVCQWLMWFRRPPLADYPLILLQRRPKE